MTTRSRHRRPASRWPLLLCALAVLVPHSGADAETITLDSMVRGTTVTPAHCAARKETVWAEAHGHGHGYCFRYYVSTEGGKGDTPVVYLSGDKVGSVNIKTRKLTPGKKDDDVDTDNLIKRADRISKATRTTAIYLARVGLDGSSGHRGIRSTFLERDATNAALNALKRKHRFAGFHLIGQSGGAGLIGGLLALRRDIGCAVPGSGRLAILKRQDPSLTPLMRRFDPIADIPTIVRISNARILVVTDPDDSKVKRKHQTSFVRKLREAGGRVELFYVDTGTSGNHGATRYATAAIGGCVRGESHAEIAKRVAEVVVKRHGPSAGEATNRKRKLRDADAMSTPPPVPASR